MEEVEYADVFINQGLSGISSSSENINTVSNPTPTLIASQLDYEVLSLESNLQGDVFAIDEVHNNTGKGLYFSDPGIIIEIKILKYLLFFFFLELDF